MGETFLLAVAAGITVSCFNRVLSAVLHCVTDSGEGNASVDYIDASSDSSQGAEAGTGCHDGGH